MDANTKTVRDVLSEINALERNYKDITDLINALNKESNKGSYKLDLPFDPTMVLMDVRTRLEQSKNALKRELDNTEITSNLFSIVR